MIVEVEVDRVRPSEFCLRDLDETVVEGLAKSIKEAGLLQPVVVRPLGDGYELFLDCTGLRPAGGLAGRLSPPSSGRSRMRKPSY